jgi:SPP1 family predicted phage head-tail adaptor
MANKIGPSTSIADRPHRVVIQSRGPVVNDVDGGFSQSWVDLATMSAKIEPATAADLEHMAGGAVISTATHIITVPYVAGVNTKGRVSFNGRSFEIVGVSNPEERNIELILMCVEASV